MNKIMMLKGGSPAIHRLGDISRENDEHIRVHEETDTHYIGNFEEGFGFINVEFKKEDCRPLTEEERKELNGKWYSINGTPLYKIYVDEQGDVVKGKTIMKKGVIDKITDSEGDNKHPNWIGLNVEFPEDIEVGVSLIMFPENDGYITTSKVINVEIIDDIDATNYVISTKNSIYFINVKSRINMNCIVCNKEIEESEFTNAILCSSECFHVNYWNEMVEIKDNPRIARINKNQYYIGEETNNRTIRGFSGRKHIIKFHDGREIINTNLWYNGEIPESHQELLPDNAEFVREEVKDNLLF